MPHLLRLLAAAAVAAAAAAGAPPPPPPAGLLALTASQQLALVSTATGRMAPYASAGVPNMGQTQQLAVVDAPRGRYVTLAFNFTAQLPSVLAFDVASGAVVADCALGWAQEGAIMGSGQFLGVDPATGLVVVAAANATTGAASVVTVDAAPGAGCRQALVASLPAELQPAVAAPGGFSPPTGELLSVWVNATTGGYTLAAVALAGGGVRTLAEDFPAGRVIQTLDFHPGEGVFYGTGLEPCPANASRAVRTLVRLDPASLAMTTVGVVAGLTVSDGVLAALDPAPGGLLYAVLQRDADGGGPDAPFYLAGLSTANGSVASLAPLAPSLGECPWSIGWWAGRGGRGAGA